MPAFVDQLVPCLLLILVQFLAALPWLWALDSRAFRILMRKPATWGNIIGAIAGLTALGAFLISSQRGSTLLELTGRVYGAVLHMQLIIDFFVVAFVVILLIWPKGGAVAMAAFREGVRQPMFWLIGGGAFAVFMIASLLPYFTFGDDFKMLKQICFDVTMVSALVFSVLAAGLSINDEIEGHTAVTLMSKPVTRRQFLLGKYLGIMLAALALTLVVSWFLNSALIIHMRVNPQDDVIDPLPVQAQNAIGPYFAKMSRADSNQLMKGFALWTGDAIANTLGAMLGFGKVMVMLAIACTLATRLPMITNLLICLAIFVLGHLAPVLRRVSEKLRSDDPENTAYKLVGFLTQMLEAITPSLQAFDMGPAIIRDTPIALMSFAKYVASASIYALIFTAIALLFGLILFEDRDLA